MFAYSLADQSVAFSPDGAHIISGSLDSTIRVWDAQAGEQLAVLEGHSGPVLAVAFSPDGAYIVSGSWDRTVSIWDARKGTQLAVLKDHSNWVLSLAFSCDGKYIISSDSWGRELVWNVEGKFHFHKQFPDLQCSNIPRHSQCTIGRRVYFSGQ
jgi:WD40 repeat protein